MGDKYDAFSNFVRGDLTSTLSSIEASAIGVSLGECADWLPRLNAASEALKQAAEIKLLAGQINVAIHALGILRCLPHILEEEEVVECVSLGAGNTGRKFDLETNKRIGEFKFIHWKGGPESIRQNSIFKDFFELSEEDTHKRKCLYLLGTAHGLKFFEGNRSLASVLSKNEATRNRFREKFGEKYETVSEFYKDHRGRVEIIDVSEWLPELNFASK